MIGDLPGPKAIKDGVKQIATSQSVCSPVSQRVVTLPYLEELGVKSPAPFIYQGAESMMLTYLVQACGEVSPEILPLCNEHDGLLVATLEELTPEKTEEINRYASELIFNHLGIRINLDLTPAWEQD